MNYRTNYRNIPIVVPIVVPILVPILGECDFIIPVNVSPTGHITNNLYFVFVCSIYNRKILKH